MRKDLAALDLDALALLTNRGLAKRAAKMLAKGEGPSLVEDAEGRVEATFGDGTVTSWPPDTALADASCTCGATKACRHRVATALAYTGTSDEAPQHEPAPGPWSPGVFSDEDLARAFGEKAVQRARARLAKGVAAVVHRGEKPWVQLDNGTVRFPVREALELSHCDAKGVERPILIILAVWAARAADEEPTPGDEQRVHLGSRALDLAPLEGLDALLARLIADGIAETPRTIAGELAAVRSAVGGWTWCEDALEDLAELITAWRERSQRYSAERAARVLAELGARGRAARGDVPPSPGWYLGVGVAPETALEHVTLTGLGARVRSADEEVEVDVYLADLRSGGVLVLRRMYPRLPGHVLGRRSLGASRLKLAALASGVLTTQGAFRRANRLLRLGGERGGRRHDLKTSAGQSWNDLPVSTPDLAALRATWAARPPAPLRPRLLAEDLRVVPVETVDGMGWEPGAERLHADVTTPSGDRVRLVVEHDPLAAGACAAVERALGDAPHHVAGFLQVDGAAWRLVPTAIACASGLVVPCFAESAPVEAEVGVPAARSDPIRETLAVARSRLAEVIHRGFPEAPELARIGGRLKQLGVRALVVASRRPQTHRRPGRTRGSRCRSPSSIRWSDARGDRVLACAEGLRVAGYAIRSQRQPACGVPQTGPVGRLLHRDRADHVHLDVRLAHVVEGARFVEREVCGLAEVDLEATVESGRLAVVVGLLCDLDGVVGRRHLEPDDIADGDGEVGLAELQARVLGRDEVVEGLLSGVVSAGGQREDSNGHQQGTHRSHVVSPWSLEPWPGRVASRH